MLRACGVSVAPKFTQVEGRILQAPKVGDTSLSFTTSLHGNLKFGSWIKIISGVYWILCLL
jgi:hypothetical protein